MGETGSPRAEGRRHRLGGQDAPVEIVRLAGDGKIEHGGGDPGGVERRPPPDLAQGEPEGPAAQLSPVAQQSGLDRGDVRERIGPGVPGRAGNVGAEDGEPRVLRGEGEAPARRLALEGQQEQGSARREESEGDRSPSAPALPDRCGEQREEDDQHLLAERHAEGVEEPGRDGMGAPAGEAATASAARATAGRRTQLSWATTPEKRT